LQQALQAARGALRNGKRVAVVEAEPVKTAAAPAGAEDRR
jgi:hypothetical protein